MEYIIESCFAFFCGIVGPFLLIFLLLLVPYIVTKIGILEFPRLPLLVGFALGSIIFIICLFSKEIAMLFHK